MPRQLVMERGAVRVTVGLDPFALELRRGRRLLRGLGLWAADGEVRDQFVQLTEGVIAHEEREHPRRLERVEPAPAARGEAAAVVPGTETLLLRGRLGDGREARLALTLTSERLLLEVEVTPAPLRVGVEWEARPGERFTGLGARHGEVFDQTGRHLRLGADRRYTGPDCPPDMLDVGGIPQGELLAAAPLDRIPVFVRSGSIVVTYPADHVAPGLGDTPEREHPLEGTLWGDPPHGRAGARLADGTRIRWRDGEWTVDPERAIRFLRT